MGRTTNWEHADGPEATIQALAGAMAPFATFLAEHNMNVYTSDDFKTGINIDKLIMAAPLLEALMLLDGRGGFFSQKALTKALGMAFTAGDCNEVFTSRALLQQRPGEEIKALTAYRVRVMLAHCRAKYDGLVAGAPPPEGLQKVFEVMEAPVVQSCKKARRAERLGSRPHPFVHFRPAPMDPTDETIAATIVTKYFDGARAVILNEDGTTTYADTYYPGENGFVVASWFLEDQTLELELTNDCCQGGALILDRPPQSVLKRPAKAPLAKAVVEAEQSEAEDEEGEEEDEEPNEESQVVEKPAKKSAKTEAPKRPPTTRRPPTSASSAMQGVAQDYFPEVVLKLVSGHNNKMTIAIQRAMKTADKAQILEVSGSMCDGTPHTPTSACMEIIQKLEPYKNDFIVNLPVARNEGLKKLREMAKAIRAEVLG